MTTRTSRSWRHFLHQLLAPVDAPSSETAYDGVSFFSASGRVEFRDGCFLDGSLDVDPLQLLALFEQLTRQAIQPNEPSTPALRLSDCVFHVVSTSFSSVCAVSSGKSRSLVLEKLPFGVLVVAFSAPLRLETVFGRVDRASPMYFCAACNVYVKDSSVAEHDQSTAHLVSSAQGVSGRKVWLPETNRGYQMLKSMGWQENGGLGPAGDGRVTPVATMFKTDRAGVGVQTSARVTHLPAHDEQQADGRREAQRMQDRLDRKRKPTQQHSVGLSKAQRKLQQQREHTRDRAIGNELYSEGLEGYEQFLR